ncbi:hypothetical protein COOONC_27234 [Cooperia oncophora]
MRLLSALPYRLVSALQYGASQAYGVRLLCTAPRVIRETSGPLDERENKEIYTTCPIDLNEPRFDKILIANRGLLL